MWEVVYCSLGSKNAVYYMCFLYIDGKNIGPFRRVFLCKCHRRAVHSVETWVVSLKTPSWHEAEEMESERKWVGVGLGLLLSNCGKIPSTFSPTHTCNTWLEEEWEAAGRKSSVDKKKLARGEKIEESEAVKSNFPSFFLNLLSFLIPLVLVSFPPCCLPFSLCLLQWLLPSP